MWCRSSISYTSIMIRTVYQRSVGTIGSKSRVSFGAFRTFCRDSHDDFKPRRKDVPEGMDDVLALIKKQVTENPIMLYMKGTPSQPQCGFSLQAVRVLNAIGANFASVNVLEYPAIREAVKEYS